MIARFVSFCLRRRWLMLVAFAAFSAFGLYALKEIAVEAYPDIGDVTCQVITPYPGHAAEEVEKQVTIPLEHALNGTPGLHVMRSRTTFGLSLIAMVFDDGTEDYFERARVTERINAVAMPPGVTPGLDPVTSPIGEIYRYTVESKVRGPRELRDLNNWTVTPALLQVPGVVNVDPFGGENTEFLVSVDPRKLAQYRLSLAAVETAINANNVNAGGSLLVRGQQSFVVRGLGAIANTTDLGNIVLTQKNGTPVFVKDIAKVEMGAVERQGILGKDDNDDAVSGIVDLLRGANPSRTLVGIHRKVAELNRRILPPDVKVVPYLDRTELINTTLRQVTHTLLEGMVLVVLVLIFFLGSVRSAALVSLTIPFALLWAFVLMRYTRVPANLLSLGAIDFGIIVDGAIVLMEVILRRRERARERELTEHDATEAVLEVARPMFFATLVIITAYLPLFAFERVEKKLFTPMAFTVGYSLIGALLFALGAMPALAFLTYRKPGHTWHNPLFLWMRQRYDHLLVRLMNRPRPALWAGAGAAILAALLALTVGREFLPYLDEGSLWLQIELPAGISISTATDMARHVRQVIRSFPEVSYAVTQTGRNDDATDPWTFSHIETSVGLKPYSQWGGDKQALIARMNDRFAKELPGIQVGFSQPMIDGIYDFIAGAHAELVVNIYGDDFAESRRIAQGVTDVLQDIRGSADVAIDQEPPLPQLQIAVNREAAARYGVNVADIADLIQTAIGGAPINSIYVGEKVYPLSLRYAEVARHDPEAIGRLTLPSSDGAAIPLSELASLKLASGESMITRAMGRRHMTVRLNLRARDLASFIREAQRSIERKVGYDHEKYEIEWAGQFENQQRAQQRLEVIIPAALGLMFLILYGAFGEARFAALILVTVPLASLGGLLALHLRDMTLNVSSAVGFIALFGVAVQNGVIMVSNLNHVRQKETDLREAVRRGARERLRPVLMTATVATLGLLPAALARGVGSDVQRPLATVIVGGLITATFLTLTVLPAAYYVMEKRHVPPLPQPYRPKPLPRLG